MQDRLTDSCPMGIADRPSIVTLEEYEIDKQTLQRMLTDFQADYLKKHKVQQTGPVFRRTWSEVLVALWRPLGRSGVHG